MAAMSNYLENKLIDAMFRGQAFTMPANIHIALFTAGPDDGAAGTEVSGGSYARVAVASSLANWAGTQAAASTTASTGTTGTTSNNSAVTFPAPTANWGTITHFALMDAASGGNVLFYGSLNTNKTVNSGDAAPQFAAGALSVQIDN